MLTLFVDLCQQLMYIYFDLMDEYIQTTVNEEISIPNTRKNVLLCFSIS